MPGLFRQPNETQTLSALQMLKTTKEIKENLKHKHQKDGVDEGNCQAELQREHVTPEIRNWGLSHMSWFNPIEYITTCSVGLNLRSVSNLPWLAVFTMVMAWRQIRCSSGSKESSHWHIWTARCLSFRTKKKQASNPGKDLAETKHIL